MNKFWIIALDVYKKNVKTLSFLILILMPFIMLGVVYLAGTFAGQMNDADKIGVYAENSTYSETIAAQDIEDYDFEVISSQAEGEKQLKSEDIDALLVITESGNQVSGELFSQSGLGQTLQLTIQQLLTSIQSSSRAQALDLSPEEVASLNEPATISRQMVSFNDDGKMELGEDNSSMQYIVSFAATIILFVFIITYAQIIAQEIASEKGTRIMEVILSSTRAQIHFYGKLTGVILVALTQLVAYALIFGVSYNWMKDMDMVKDVLASFSADGIFGPFLAYTVIFILFGILLYAVLAALCGSLVNRSEDTTKAIVPVTYLSLGGYMIGIVLGASDPNNIIIQITSYIPFLSSYIMPIRLANDTVSTSGALISVVILAVTTVVLTLMSARMYKSNVLIYNDNGILATMKQSFSLMKSEKK